MRISSGRLFQSSAARSPLVCDSEIKLNLDVDSDVYWQHVLSAEFCFSVFSWKDVLQHVCVTSPSFTPPRSHREPYYSSSPTLLTFRAHSNGSIRRGLKTDPSEAVTMRSGLGVNLKDVTVFTRGREKGAFSNIIAAQFHFLSRIMLADFYAIELQICGSQTVDWIFIWLV